MVPGVAAALAPLTNALHYEKAPGEPTVSLVETVAATLLESGCDSVAAIGGGSAMDTAKGARLVAGQGGPYMRFARGEATYEAPQLPLVCVPTTAGTGSEVSGGAVITDEATHTKAGIASPLLRAQHALVDPVLTHGLPPKLTAYTGIDALAQAIAAMVVKVRTPIGDGIALESIRLAGEALPRVVADGSDAAARSAMACSSLMAGLCMNISDCGSEHSLGQAHRRPARPPARPHHWTGAGRDDGSRPRARARSSSNASPMLWVSLTTALVTGRGQYGRYGRCSSSWSSRR